MICLRIKCFHFTNYNEFPPFPLLYFLWNLLVNSPQLNFRWIIVYNNSFTDFPLPLNNRTGEKWLTFGKAFVPVCRLQSKRLPRNFLSHRSSTSSQIERSVWLEWRWELKGHDKYVLATFTIQKMSTRNKSCWWWWGEADSRQQVKCN